MITQIFRNYRKTFFLLIVLVILAAIGLNLWYQNIYTDSRRVFDAMLNNSLRTSSVTKQVVQQDTGQSLDQKIYLKMGEYHVAQSVSNLNQTGGNASAQVVTESIGTPFADYVRYLAIQTDQKSQSGGELDFSKIIGTWGASVNEGSTAGELYNEMVLGVIPIGNVPADQRTKLMKLANDLDVYKVEYENMERSTVNGRPTYTYTVKVLPEAYVSFLKAYAESVGLTQLRNVRPSNYASADPIEFKVGVDVMTRRLASVTYASGRTEQYIGYGQQVDVTIPTDTVGVEELQQRIQQVQ